MDSTVKVRDFITSASTPPRRREFIPPSPVTARLTRVPKVSEAPPRPFQDCDLAFAIDISQSTRGSILAEECALVENFDRNLTRRARGCVRVLPWDQISHKVITVRELATIDPAGTTDPNVLLQDKSYLDSLQSCHLWFLLTDGEILPASVRRFALNINSRSLHGTPCVLVIFGSRPEKPLGCNISVGISVFGVSPNCIFLFHDVNSHEAYILQCKGCFNTLLPAGLEQLSLDKDTEWYHLPRLDWVRLLNVLVPAPIKLDEDQLQLQSGKQIRLEDLYSERLHHVVLSEIFSNDDNLKSIILTATTRGQGRQIHDWIARRRDPFSELSEVPRPDIGGNASRLVRLIIQGKSQTRSTSDLVEELRKAHVTNWEAFKAFIEPRTRQAAQQSKVADDTLRRISEIEEYGLSSPGGLGPVSLRAQRMQRETDLGPSSKLLFSRGYCLDRSFVRAIQECQICERRVAEVAILLKRPPDGTTTTGFPLPQSQSGILFPLAIARYRETDIISKLVCCDPCSSFAVDHGLSPDGEHLVGALMVGEALLLADVTNRITWLKALEKAFEGRISMEQLLLGALAVLYDARDQATSDPLSCQAYYRACTMIENYAQVPYEVGNLHWTGGINDVVSHYLSIGITSPKCDFLSHPVESFVCMIRASQEISAERKAPAVFLRFVLHIIEYNMLIQDTERGNTATEFMNSLRHTDENGDATYEPSLLSMESLCEQYVVDEEAVAVFRNAGSPFSLIEDRSETAILLFLCLFGTINTGCTDARQILNWFCGKTELNMLFHNPWHINQNNFQNMWKSLS